MLAVFLLACSQRKSEQEAAFPALNVSWEENQAGQYTLELANVKLAVDRQAGDRIVTLAIDDANLLTGPDIDSINYGSTLLLSL